MHNGVIKEDSVGDPAISVVLSLCLNRCTNARLRRHAGQMPVPPELHKLQNQCDQTSEKLLKNVPRKEDLGCGI
ncbi:hypothetical protein AVEN_33435-1 [Araneus ventricosus]|uniref:Uncharacterized protein n=1 Tax=Araneus ventricosus TaxID=182803 RepID=A0A4Y2IU97_ARAVE|nr:hypothetical protein AVEN_33435-1 [Araneus ventricosus]